MDENTLYINEHLRIPKSELAYRFARSGGPGGQHVNRSETQVELLWDVRNSLVLNEEQRARIFRVLAKRIDKAGVLHLTSSETRSQERNRAAVTDRFMRLLQEALKPQKKRKKRRISKAAKEKRLQEKRRRSEIKRLRRSLDE